MTIEPFINTADYIVTSPFGERPSLGDFHNGVDMVPSDHSISLIKSVLPGVAKINYNHPIYGNYIQIYNSYYNITVDYCHLDEIEIVDNCVVNCGDIIGKMGNTGASQGYHLHLGVYTNDRYVDPISYFESLTDKNSLINGCYVAVLNRTADENGFESYNESNMNFNEIIKDLMNSGEFKEIYITRCYEQFLHREPESADVIESRLKLSLEQIANDIYNSDEAKKIRKNQGEFKNG